MSKLYPPQLEDTLPAVIKGNALVIPFQLNRAVSRHEVTKMAIILKTVQTNTVLCNGQTQYHATSISYSEDKGCYLASFPQSISETMMQIGQYYKVQIACVDNANTIGYYSTASILKCTSMPLIYIDGLNSTQQNNIHKYSYTGVYSQEDEDITIIEEDEEDVTTITTEEDEEEDTTTPEEDTTTKIKRDKTEKVYSYRFNLKNEQGDIIATSGELIHNSAKDEERYKSSDTWNVAKNLLPGYKYYIQYTVTTLNNLVVSSPSYSIMAIETVDTEFPADLHATMDHVDGYVDLKLKSHDNETAARGSFILIRSSEEDNYDTWQQLYKFDLVNKIPNINLWQDFTVQQGMHYKYALQAYNNNGLYSNKIMNVEGPVFADFEDAFLFDGERQLNIRYNPKVSSFKTTILESKLDTLGGKYPFIFRNGNVRYQEFPISGLISMLSDPNEIFIEGINGIQDEPTRDRTKSGAPAQNLRTQLLGDNFRKERQFKLEVLNWLNDGKPKLFRSPGEGNYIVRLMNVSLSPNDTLGRMLHTFSCTAYEIADYTFENLNKYKFVKAPISTYSETSMGQRNLREVFGGVETPADGTEYTIEPSAALSLSISEQYYDSLILKFEYQGGTVSDNLEICNPTGQLNIPITDKPITKIIFVSGKIAKEALMTYVYEDVNIENNFSQITNITIEDKIAQYVGGNKDENLIETLEDIKFQTGRFYYINATPRRILIIHTKDGEYYKDEDHKLPQTTWDKTVVYEVVENGKYLYGSPDDEREVFPDYNLTINSESYSNLEPALHGGVYRTQGDFKTITNLDRVDTLKFGSGIILNLVYQLKTLHYGVETTDVAVAYKKEVWETDKTNINKYKDYIKTLENALRAEKEVN